MPTRLAIFKPIFPQGALSEPAKGVPRKISPTTLLVSFFAASSAPYGRERALATTRPPRLCAT